MARTKRKELEKQAIAKQQNAAANQNFAGDVKNLCPTVKEIMTESSKVVQTGNEAVKLCKEMKTVVDIAQAETSLHQLTEFAYLAGDGVSVQASTSDSQFALVHALPGMAGINKSKSATTFNSPSKSCLSSPTSKSPSLPKAFVCVEDISKSPDESLLRLMKKCPGRLGSSDEVKTKQSTSKQQRLPPKSSLMVNGDTEFSSSSVPGGLSSKKLSTKNDVTALTNDKTVASSISTGNKNIFEQFDTELVGRRSPRRSNSPRAGVAYSCAVQDSMPNGNEEKQQQNIVSAVKVLRGLSDKATTEDGCSPAEKISIDVISVNTTSPEESPLISSPVRHSPRRSGEKVTPLGSGQKKLTCKQSQMSSSSDNNEAASVISRRNRSPRKLSEDMIALPLISPRKCRVSKDGESGLSPETSSKSKSVSSISFDEEKRSFQVLSSTDHLGHSSDKPSSVKSSASCQLFTPSDISCNQDITSMDTKPVVGIDTKPIANIEAKPIAIDTKPIVGTDTKPIVGTDTEPFVGADTKSIAIDNEKPDLKINKQESTLSGKNNRNKCCGKSVVEDLDSSLLCAMLTGGSEVAKTYEQNRELIQAANTVVKSQQKSISSPLAQTFSQSSMCNDDVRDKFPVRRPLHELPVLRNLPPIKCNVAVLDLTLNEPKQSSNNDIKRPLADSVKPNGSLVNLIMKVHDYLKLLPQNVDKDLLNDEAAAFAEGSQDSSRLEESSALPQTSCSESEQNLDPAADASQPISDKMLTIAERDRTVYKASKIKKHSEKESLANLVNAAFLSEACQKMSLKDRELSALTDHCISDLASDSDKGIHSNDRLADPASPNSLGELDTERITQDATQAVRRRFCQAYESVTFEINSESSEPTSISKYKSLKDRFSQLSETHKQNDSVASTSGAANSLTNVTRMISDASLDGTEPSEAKERMISCRSRWKLKTESVLSGRPLWSRWHKVIAPSSLDILRLPEIAASDHKLHAFSSQNLDDYLKPVTNRTVIPAGKNSELARIILSGCSCKDMDEFLAALEKTTKQEASDGEGQIAVSDCEEEAGYFPMGKTDPDFDEVEGVVFVSFTSESAMKAHIEVEKALTWDNDPAALLSIARFRALEGNRRNEEGCCRDTYGFRGLHMRWRKYLRLYRRQLKKMQEEDSCLMARFPGKTMDISKIKNWKTKHEHKLTKQDGSYKSQYEDDLELQKKKKRKTYVFSARKKKVISAVPQTTEVKMETTSEDLVSENPDLDDSYGHPIDIDKDNYMQDVENSVKEMERKQKCLMCSKMIFTKMCLDSQDRHVFKKLGGWVTRLRGKKKLAGEKVPSLNVTPVIVWKAPKKYKRRKLKSVNFEFTFISERLIKKSLSALMDKPRVKRQRCLSKADAGSNDVSKLNEKNLFVNLASENNLLIAQAKEPCNKPGCRYGCICHLCLPVTESGDEQDKRSSTVLQQRVCDKEYCRLGCICESLEKSSNPSVATHCGKVECILKCICKEQKKDFRQKSTERLTLVRKEIIGSELKTNVDRTETIDLLDSSGDELPMLEKTVARRQRATDRYSNLPRRQTSYRIAKNLDAVSRKAMMLYETSEIYWEQSGYKKRFKSFDSSSNTPISPAFMTTPSPPAPATLLSSVICSQSPPLTLSGMLSVPDGGAVPVILRAHTGEMSSEQSSVSPSTDNINIKQDKHQAKFESKRSKMKKSFFNAVSPLHSPTLAKTLRPATVLPTSSSPAPQHLSTPPTISQPSSANISRWHTAMVCLKANPVRPVKEEPNSGSEDIQEEDEIKLLELIANCNWFRAKKDILQKVAQCLSRGRYPTPRTMFVGDFRVEILPKADKPSVIPPELRSKLPEMMYSIRLRVTQFRNSVGQVLLPQPVNLIKNTATSPSSATSSFPFATLVPVCNTTSDTVTQFSEANKFSTRSLLTKTPSSTSNSTASDMNTSSIGISGLGQLQISQGDALLHTDSVLKRAQDLCLHKGGQDSGKQRKRKKKIKEKVAKVKNQHAHDISSKKSKQHGESDVPVVFSYQSGAVPVGSQPMPLHKVLEGKSGVQILGPFPNLGNLRFLQIPGQKHLLQLVPASALGLPVAEKQGVANLVAVPVPLAPIAGNKKVEVAEAETKKKNKSSKASSLLRDSLTVDMAARSDSKSQVTPKKKKKKMKKTCLSAEDLKKEDGNSTGVSNSVMPIAQSEQPLIAEPQEYLSEPHPVQLVMNVGALAAAENCAVVSSAVGSLSHRPKMDFSSNYIPTELVTSENPATAQKLFKANEGQRAMSIDQDYSFVHSTSDIQELPAKNLDSAGTFWKDRSSLGSGSRLLTANEKRILDEDSHGSANTHSSSSYSLEFFSEDDDEIDVGTDLSELCQHCFYADTGELLSSCDSCQNRTNSGKRDNFMHAER